MDSTMGIFIAAAALLVVMPGPNTLYIVTRSVQQGTAAGLASCLGILTGTLFHVTVAALGFSALLLSSALAFSIVKYLGAAYLIYLGTRTLLARDALPDLGKPVAEAGQGRIFYQGIMVNVLNPKTALFIAAFLPQFVDVKRGSIAGQIFFLGAVLALIGTVSDMSYALIAGKVGRWLHGKPRFVRSRRYLAGSVYIGLGVATVFAGASRK